MGDAAYGVWCEVGDYGNMSLEYPSSLSDIFFLAKYFY